jgi:hypothetical protein
MSSCLSSGTRFYSKKSVIFQGEPMNQRPQQAYFTINGYDFYTILFFALPGKYPPANLILDILIVGLI